MGDVVRFPPRPPAEDGFHMQVTPERCEGIMHVFTEVPGKCQCGSEYWSPEGHLIPGDTPHIGLHWVA